jgi:uncharacterized protein (TIGR02996 family)
VDELCSFLDALLQNPSDDTLRRVFADFLLERGDPRGEWMRLQFELMDSPAHEEVRDNDEDHNYAHSPYRKPHHFAQHQLACQLLRDSLAPTLLEFISRGRCPQLLSGFAAHLETTLAKLPTLCEWLDPQLHPIVWLTLELDATSRGESARLQFRKQLHRLRRLELTLRGRPTLSASSAEDWDVRALPRTPMFRALRELMIPVPSELRVEEVEAIWCAFAEACVNPVPTVWLAGSFDSTWCDCLTRLAESPLFQTCTELHLGQLIDWPEVAVRRLFRQPFDHVKKLVVMPQRYSHESGVLTASLRTLWEDLAQRWEAEGRSLIWQEPELVPNWDNEAHLAYRSWFDGSFAAGWSGLQYHTLQGSDPSWSAVEKAQNEENFWKRQAAWQRGEAEDQLLRNKLPLAGYESPPSIREVHRGRFRNPKRRRG